MNISRDFELDMGHCLASHEGQCHRPHGHRYKVTLTASGDLVDDGSERGMVRDFAALRTALEVVVGQYDHRFMMETTDPRTAGAIAAFGDGPANGLALVDFPPTAEHLAAYWGWQLAGILRPVEVVELVVWETPNCRAAWRP